MMISKSTQRQMPNFGHKSILLPTKHHKSERAYDVLVCCHEVFIIESHYVVVMWTARFDLSTGTCVDIFDPQP